MRVTHNVYIGIDPGKSGAIAVIHGDDVIVRPYSNDTLLSALCGLDYEGSVMCVLERVHAMPGQGVTSMFNFGMNFGYIQGVLEARNVPYQLVTPQKWKKEFEVTADKNTSIQVARRLFPNVDLRASLRSRKDNDGMAEALLMAEYGRRKL